jgi:hypothetical protein
MSRIEHFKTKKERYLDDHTIWFGGEKSGYSTWAGVEYFDLVPILNKPKNYTLTRRFKPTEKEQKDLICAAWLPAPGEIDLGEKAYENVEYFFTAELTGCRLEIGCAARPKVLHIHASQAGFPDRSLDEMSKESIAKYDTRMDAMANAGFEQLPHRKYSKRSGYPTPLVEVTVVGYWKQTMWQFYAQERLRGKKENVTRPVVRQIVTTEKGQGEACELR